MFYYSMSLACRLLYLSAFGLDIWIELHRPWPCKYIDIQGGLSCGLKYIAPFARLSIWQFCQASTLGFRAVACLFLIPSSNTLVLYPSKSAQRCRGKCCVYKLE